MANLPRLSPATLDFVLLSFEGPDQYSMAGGLGVRMKELALELAHQGFRTHLVFVGDPNLPAQESPADNLTLHRWSQWLSAHYPAGVYHGEESKLVDWNEQLPQFVASHLVGPAAREGRITAILAEEWHTAYATCQISDRLWTEGLRDKAIVLWNANNVMGFDRIDWRRLDFCSQITTVSRYMKHVMWDRAVNPLVIPNGIPGNRVCSAGPGQVARLRAAFTGRELLFKIGRFSPDKRWNMAMDALAQEKGRGRSIAAVIRGGVEPHGVEVLANARHQGLTVVDVKPPREVDAAIEALAAVPAADVYNITSFMSDELISLFYSASDAVLANSGHEPFGLVGLEVMAAGGVAFVGSTGEDYAVPFLNSVVLDTDDPAEIGIALDFLRSHPEVAARLRSDGQETARSFSWENVIFGTLLGKLEYVAKRQLVNPPRATAAGMGDATGAGAGAEPASAAGPLAGATGPAGAAQAPNRAAGDANSLSLAYGGASAPTQLSIKPRIPGATARPKKPAE
jgi:glycosyltransferase involved in cell wall biosynthesis